MKKRAENKKPVAIENLNAKEGDAQKDSAEIEETLKLSTHYIELNPLERITQQTNTRILLNQLRTEENSQREERHEMPSEIDMQEIQKARESAETRMFRIN